MNYIDGIIILLILGAVLFAFRQIRKGKCSGCCQTCHKSCNTEKK